AAQNTLRRLEREEQTGNLGPISRLLLHLDNNFGTAQTLIAEMLEKRDQWLRHTGSAAHLIKAREQLERSFQKLIIAELEKLQSVFTDDIAQEIVAVCRFAGLPDHQSNDLEEWRAMANLLLTKSGTLRKKPENTIFARNYPLKKRCEALLARLRGEDA